MKKVLFIDYFFPPLLADWRGLAFSKLLPEFGWQPIVLAADPSVAYGKDYSLLAEVPAGTEVHRVGHRAPAPRWQSVRRRLRIAADFPDAYKSWYDGACAEARAILRSTKIDLIYSASPTFVTAFVARQIQRETGLPWVADFLDGWAVNDFLLAEYQRSLIGPVRWWQTRRIRRAEQDILTRADHVVTIHDHVRQRWLALHQVDAHKISVVTDGFEEEAFRDLTPRTLYPGRLTITFLGSYYDSFREPIAAFLRAVRKVQPAAEIVFVGRVAAQMQQLDDAGLTCIGHLPRRKSFEFALGSDFLFVVMPPFARWTPTKTYDYLRLGKPILALVPDDGDTARLVREACAGFVLAYDETQMRQQLSEIFQRWHSSALAGFEPRQEVIARFERRAITAQMARVFEAACQSGDK